MTRESQEEFIAQCEKKYGKGRYDYSETRFTAMKDQIRVICPKPGHGPFRKRAQNFLELGQGCWRCFLEERNSMKEAAPASIVTRAVTKKNALWNLTIKAIAANAAEIRSNQLAAYLRQSLEPDEVEAAKPYLVALALSL